MLHDENYKRLFASKLMVEHLLRACLPDDLLAAADFSELGKLSTEYVSDELLERHGDTVWRLRARERREMREQAERERREMNKRWGELANRMGTLVEDIVAPSIGRLAREVFDCGEQQYFATRVVLKRSDDPSREREFDALYVGADAVLLNETKSTPRTEYVREFVRFVDGGEFALYFPQYAHLPVRPAFSSLNIPPDTVRFLTRSGVYAIAMGDEAMQVLNLQAVRSRRA